MNILIVGNVIKDVYLSIDSRTEHLETDRNNTKWLELSFDASKHRYFHRVSSFGGAAVSLEVLTKMNLNASIINSDFKYEKQNSTLELTPSTKIAPHTYRYILTSDDSACYLTPTNYVSAKWQDPAFQPDYIYIDRSANLDLTNIELIQNYLETHINTGLIIHLKDNLGSNLESLIPYANLIFIEDSPDNTKNHSNLPSDKTVFLTEQTLYYKNISESVTIERIDKLTHLSIYSIAATTILGGFLLGKTIEESFRLARANLEHATLDSTLTLKELEQIASAPSESLELITATLMSPKKGILAADESGGSIHKKFESMNIPDTYENRHDYRNIFFTTPNIENYLNGVILFEETARDHMDTGESIPDFLISHRIIPGIKVDQGLENLSAPHETDTFTKGLDGLDKRLREYYEMGLRFAKWRAAFNIHPSQKAIDINTDSLAKYAKKCQSAGLIPIVEPEVIYDDNYSINDNKKTTSLILDTLFQKLKDYDVNLRACILKCNMVLAGKQFHTQSTPEEVGLATAETLKNHVPEEIAGIVFLSGGQTPEQATDNLTAIIKSGPFPWPVSFSFARALQDPALHAWQGNNGNTEKARQAFLDRLIANTKIL